MAVAYGEHSDIMQYVGRALCTPLKGLLGHRGQRCMQMDGCPWSMPQLVVLSFTARTDLSLFLHLHARAWPPFIKARSWLGQVTLWGCVCHLGNTLYWLKLFFFY